uniref:PHD-type domain-containing protein n=1 Tax=Salix viminalis TaxID=40686 RepID=A0A6N2L3Q0_SALVM
MGRGEKVNWRGNLKKRARDKDKDSDDSDEDYVIENEENISDDDSEDCRVSLDGYASEESFDSFVEEEFRKPVRSKKKSGSLWNGKVEGKTSQKRKRASYDDEDEEYINDDEGEDDEEFTPDDDEGEDDEEFTPDEDDDDDDCLNGDEELTVKRKSRNVKLIKERVPKGGSGRGRKRIRKSRVLKKPLAKKGRNKRKLKKKERCEYDDEDDGDFLADSPIVRETSKKHSGVRKRKFAVNSDSDFLSNGSSDCDYTISEEEREQVREASQLYGELKTSLRSSSAGKRFQENGDSCKQTKSPVRKGKEKVEEVKSELGRQVCGICLSEEDKRRFRGTLDCCLHYFCFTCIMEWSKVESRCPLCKQRFRTITKNGRSIVGVDLRNMVIQVPKRDQVYQPTEEEIRSYIDPYENVICKECHESGDDGLMLLCDLCDSSAHTYCVGLGRQVPEGNWYCDDCRHVALGSSSSQTQDPLPDQWNISSNIFNRPSLVLNLEDGLHPNLESSPRLTVPQAFGSLSSPRFPTGENHVASPVSGAGASTLSGRRHIHRNIRILLSNMNPSTNINPMANRIDVISAASLRSDLSNSQIDLGRETGLQNLRTQEVDTSEQTLHEERLQANDHPSSSFQNRDSFYLVPNQLTRQTAQDPSIPTADRSINLTLWPELVGINSMPGYEQPNEFGSKAMTGPGGTLSSNQVREESQFYDVKEKLQSMVKNHLGSLSHDTELDHDTFKDISRSSTHTILAACGLEHKRSEVHTVPPPSTCIHIDRVVAGQRSPMKGCCSSCFDSFVRDVVKRIMDKRPRQWLTLVSAHPLAHFILHYCQVDAKAGAQLSPRIL